MTTVREVSFRPAVNDDLVERLEGLVADAKAGRLASGCFAGLLRSGEVISTYSSTENRILEIAALSRLLHRLHLMCDETAIPE